MPKVWMVVGAWYGAMAGKSPWQGQWLEASPERETVLREKCCCSEQRSR